MSVKYNMQGFFLFRLFRIGYWQVNPICIWRSLFLFMEYILKTRHAVSFTGSDRYTLIPVEVNVREFMSPAEVCNNSNRFSNKSMK
jgi:hypothetical protein